MTEDHFKSIDATLAAARQSWEEEKKTLESKITGLEFENSLLKEAITKAGEARDRAMAMSVKLVTQFGIVATVFDDARKLAIEAGLYTETSKPDGAVNGTELHPTSDTLPKTAI